MEVKTGYTLIKHYYSHQFDDLAHNKVTFDVAEDASLDQMLDAFEHFLKASGFSFDGQLDFVKDDEVDPFIEELVNQQKSELPYASDKEIADEKIGKWLSAALEDTSTCQSMKDDINEWFRVTELPPVRFQAKEPHPPRWAAKSDLQSTFDEKM